MNIQYGIGSEFGINKQGGYNIHAHTAKRLTGNVLYVNNGRAALGLIAKYTCSITNSRNTFLLPAYLCGSMIQPFQELGIPVKFYKVNSGLNIHYEDIAEQVDDHVAGVLLMHYFGFPQRNDLVSKLHTQFPNIHILNDRTHCLLTDMMTGGNTINGNASVAYSPRKWGPFPDLGLVLLGNQPPFDSNIGSLIESGLDVPFAFSRAWALILRTLFFALPTDFLRKVSFRSAQKAEAVLHQRILLRHPLSLSVWLWNRWDWRLDYEQRRINYAFLFKNWASNAAQPIMGKLPDGVCPLGFSVRSNQRDALRKHLIDHKIFPAIHWLRPDQIEPQDFPEAALLSGQELTIPIDQRYNTRHMEYILDVLKEFA